LRRSAIGGVGIERHDVLGLLFQLVAERQRVVVGRALVDLVLGARAIGVVLELVLLVLLVGGVLVVV